MVEWHPLLWCNCDNKILVIRENIVFCKNCDSPIPCEFCEPNDIAIIIHVVCNEHKKIVRINVN